MDGTFVTVPKDALRGVDGASIIENHGAEPDLLLQDFPGDLAAGLDKQLETAVQIVMRPQR